MSNYGPGNVCEEGDMQQTQSESNNNPDVNNDAMPACTESDADQDDDEDNIPISQLLNTGKNSAPPPLKKCKASEVDNAQPKFQFRVPTKSSESKTDSATKITSEASSSVSGKPNVDKAKGAPQQPKSKGDTLPKVVPVSPDDKFEKVLQIFQDISHSELDAEIDAFCASIGLKLQKVPSGEA